MADGSPQASAPSRSSSGPDPLIGRLINDRFKVVALVARGGMGKVYRSEQAPLGRTCALKVLNPKYAGDHDPEFHKRFFLEASIASKLTHPNTVTIFDYGRTDDEVYYMAMEYLEGRTLHRAIREEGSFGEERTAHIARQICRSLREAHSLGVIHRDLKPANIYLVDHADEHDFVKVLDFGLVKNVENPGEDLTQAGLFMGSPKYMAPEQIKGDKVDGRTDIYALGIIMYEMLTGKVPFDRPNSVHIMMAHVNEPPPPMRSINPDIQISPSSEELILRCLDKDPENRYPSMEYLLNSLKSVGGGAMTATLSGVLSSGDFMAATGSSGAVAAGNTTGPNQPMFLSATGSTSESGPIVQPGMDSTDAMESGKKGSKSILAIAIAVVLVVGIGGVAFFATRDPSAGTTPQPSATASAVPTETATASATETASAAPIASAPVKKVAVIKVESKPAGASVKDKDGKELCEATPCELKFEGDEAEDGKEHELVFSKPGYRNVKKTVKVSDEKTEARLPIIRTGGGRPPATKPPSTATAPPPGFKDIPY